MSPSPPPPAIAAIGAVATTVTAATRMPAKSSGSASGSSTRRRICDAGHAHPTRGLDRIAIDPVDAVERVRQDRPGREHGEGDHVVDEADSENRQERGDQDDARQRPPDDRGADRNA